MTTANNSGGEESRGWIPFGLDEAATAAHTALTPGVPAWLETSLWEWILDQFVVASNMTSHGRIVWLNMERLRQSERVLRARATGLDGTPHLADDVIVKLKRSFGRTPTETLRLADFCASSIGQMNAPKLRAMLTEAGSAWTVGVRHGRPGLVQRMPDGVMAAAQEAFTYGDAGKRLASAWEAVFGITPDPEAGYSRAVKAVEDAAIPVVSPTNKSATLGTVIAQIRDSGRFRLPHLREHSDAKSHNVLLSMLQMLWTGQHDRHGGPSQVPVPNVTQDEAETAVILATSLVGWFATGKVQK